MKVRARALVTALLIGTAAAMSGCAFHPPKTIWPAPLPALTQEQAAKDGLVSLTPANFPTKGVTLGEPFPVVFLGLNQLQSYAPGQDPETLIKTSHEAFFPIMVDGTCRGAIKVGEIRTGSWSALEGSFGSGDADLVTLRSDLETKLQLPASAFFIIESHGVNGTFLAYRTAAHKLVLVAPYNLGFTWAQPGQQLPADYVFSKMHSEALRSNAMSGGHPAPS